MRGPAVGKSSGPLYGVESVGWEIMEEESKKEVIRIGWSPWPWSHNLSLSRWIAANSQKWLLSMTDMDFALGYRKGKKSNNLYNLSRDQLQWVEMSISTKARLLKRVPLLKFLIDFQQFGTLFGLDCVPRGRIGLGPDNLMGISVMFKDTQLL